MLFRSELTSYEVALCNSDNDSIGATRIGNPTAKYNCHSYAWYKKSGSVNLYWIDSIDEFIADNECSLVDSGTSSTSAQVNDIIVYLNQKNARVHSGVISAVSSSGELTVESKWGKAGVYSHRVNQVPAAYRPQGSSVARTKIYRYHDYKYQYTGQNYHQGSRHYFQYATKCTVCFAQKGDAVWKFKACSGSPCVSPASIPDIAS